MKNTNNQLNMGVTSDIAAFLQYQTPNTGNPAGNVGDSRCVQCI